MVDQSRSELKGPYVVVEEKVQTQTSNIHNNKLSNVFFSHNWINKLSSEENKVPRS